MKPSTLNLSRLASFARHIENDSESSLVDLQQRDREIGISAKQTSRLHKLLWWLSEMDERSPINSKNELTQDVEIRISFWMVIIGSLVGMITMSGLLMVENQRPVNVLVFLTLFIGSQIVLIFITMLLAFTPRSKARLAYFPFETINPAGIFFRRAIRRLSKGIRWEYFSDLSRIALLRWGQIFGIAFNGGGLIAFVVILFFTDRSFGWGSTIDLSDNVLHKIISLLSLPWQFFWPDAQITSEIIANTRYQSLQTEFLPGQLILMRQWWPFLLGCIITYGLLPRIILLVLFQFKYNRSLVNTFLHYPGARLILDRMESPLVATKTETVETLSSEPLTKNTINGFSNLGSPLVVSWTEAIKIDYAEAFLASLGIHPCKILIAGINLEQSKSAEKQINNSKAQKNIIVAVKSWEPPLQELQDFIDTLDNIENCELLLVPLTGKKIKQNELRDWQNFFAGKNNIKLVLGGEIESCMPGNDSQKTSVENL